MEGISEFHKAIHVLLSYTYTYLFSNFSTVHGLLHQRAPASATVVLCPPTMLASTIVASCLPSTHPGCRPCALATVHSPVGPWSCALCFGRHPRPTPCFGIVHQPCAPPASPERRSPSLKHLSRARLLLQTERSPSVLSSPYIISDGDVDPLLARSIAVPGKESNW
jgi:hypothetical protein